MGFGVRSNGINSFPSAYNAPLTEKDRTWKVENYRKLWSKMGLTSKEGWVDCVSRD